MDRTVFIEKEMRYEVLYEDEGKGVGDAYCYSTLYSTGSAVVASGFLSFCLAAWLPGWRVPRHTVRYCTEVRSSTVQYSTVQYSIVQCSSSYGSTT